MKNISKFFLIQLGLIAIQGCTSVADHRQALRDSSSEKLTLGIAQREIKVGMSQADVARALGSPNMVTKDRDGIETWIYDKISTEIAYSTSANGVNGLILGSGPSVLSGGAGTASQASGAASRNQRTLTIVIKFNQSAVSEFTYNSTSF